MSSSLSKVLFYVFLSSSFLVQAGPEDKYSGYLDDYSQLTEKKFDNGGIGMVWLSPELANRSYEKVIIEKVTVFPGSKDDDAATTQLVSEVTAYLDAALSRELGGVLEVTNQEGPDTVIMRFAITGVDISNQSRKAYEYVPVAFVFSAAKTAAGKRAQMVEVFLEGLMIDSVSGQVLGRAVRKGLGEPLGNKDDQLGKEDMHPQLNLWAQDAKSLAVIVKGQ